MGQVRAKLKCEQRKNADKVEEALRAKQALTRAAYEEKHGAIDTS